MSDDLFPRSDSASVDDPDILTPVESSGISTGSSVAAPAGASAAKVAPQRTAPASTRAASTSAPSTFTCEHLRCGKIFKRKANYEKHVIAHNISDANARLPSVAQFRIVMDELMGNVLNQLGEEHKLGSLASLKKEFLEIVKNRQESRLWAEFVTSISDPLLTSLTNPSKLLPQNKYEEALKKLNAYLNDINKLTILCNKLQLVTVDCLVLPNELCRRLVFRISSKLLDQIQIFMAREMKSLPESDYSLGVGPMSEDERNQFMSVLGSLLRSLFRKGCEKKKHSQMFRSLCKCLKQNFVYVSDTHEPISSSQFLDSKLWFAVGEGSSIKLSEKATEFFIFVESVLFKNETVCPLDDVMNTIYCSRDILALWGSLTSSFFGDENSVYVMKIFVSAFRESSIRLELRYRNYQEKSKKKVSNVALRTSLKTN